jgi:transcriptional regulator with XRE-family HTH domain
VVGDRIREARNVQQRSLADIAAKAGISVATLSRVENSKQALDLEMFLSLAKILNIAPAQLLGDDSEGESEPLAEKLARLSRTERTKLWRELAGAKRHNANARHTQDRVAAQVDELLAQIEFVRSELETVRKRIGRAPKRRA